MNQVRTVEFAQRAKTVIPNLAFVGFRIRPIGIAERLAFRCDSEADEVVELTARIAFNINVDGRPRQAKRGRTENVDLVFSNGESFESRMMLWRRRGRPSWRPKR